MGYEVVCSCGAVLTVSEGMAGSTTSCHCGRTVAVPSLSALRAREITAAMASPVSDLGLQDATPPGPTPLTEIIAPMQVDLRTEVAGQPNRRASVMAALMPEAIWIQDTWQTRPVPLPGLGIERRRKVLALTLGPEPSAERLMLTFASAAEAERWCREIQVRQQQLTLDGLRGNQYSPEGVALVRQAPKVPHVDLGPIEFTGQTQWAADRGLQLRAGVRGADAIIELHRQKCPEMGWGARHVRGIAVRVEDADARKRLRLRWYTEEVRALVNRMVLLLVIEAAVLFLIVMSGVGGASLQAPTGDTASEALASAGLGLGMLFAWPLVLLALLRVLRWPQLLRIAGLTTLAVTTGRGIIVWLAHLLAVWTTGAALGESKIWILVDPVDWAIVIAGVVLCIRAWRLAGAARQILPPEMQTVPTARKAWARGLLAATGVYAVVLLGIAGASRYQTSEQEASAIRGFVGPDFVIRGFGGPYKVDHQREHEAVLAFNTGVDQGDRGDLGAAEQSYQRSLRLWEGLTARRSAPSIYRINLARTLNNLGCIHDRQGHLDQAERYYARAVALGDELAGDPNMDDEFKQILTGARQVLAHIRDGKSLKLLEEKDKAAFRKYEEAQVKAQKGEVEAEKQYQEALALWEEILPQVTNEKYRKAAVVRFAIIYLELGELQQRLGKRAAAEATLKKAIDYGEKAVAQEPDRPLPKHNLEVARQMLDELHEQALQEEVAQLCEAQRFADALDRCRRGIEEQEEQVRSSKDHEAAVRRLAYRLDRFAWLLAHCPDGRVRDTKVAVKQARRATTLRPDVADYWYTLAMVEYRNGDWRDSLAALEKVKAKEGALDASGWFLSAMNLHQLKRRKEATAALGKAVEWINARKRQAEDNALLRFQYEMARPTLEALQREAEDLIAGKDPSNQGIG